MIIGFAGHRATVTQAHNSTTNREGPISLLSGIPRHRTPGIVMLFSCTELDFAPGHCCEGS